MNCDCGRALAQRDEPVRAWASELRPSEGTLAEIAAGLAELGTGGTPAFIRGYNRGYDDAYEHAQSPDQDERLRQRIEALPRYTSPDGEETWLEWAAVREAIAILDDAEEAPFPDSFDGITPA